MKPDGIWSTVDEVLETDVLVIGSDVGGCCAAIQAAWQGCDVILVEKDDVLGGNSGPNLGIHVSGAHSFHPYGGETGIIEEIELEAAWRRAKIRTYACTTTFPASGKRSCTTR
jgi:glycine/D-amino acid oxidase-like deaminating enzyme